MVGFAQIIQVFEKVVQDCANTRRHAHSFIGFSWGSKSLSPLALSWLCECRTSPASESTLYPFIEWLSMFKATQLCYVVLRSEIQIVDIEDGVYPVSFPQTSGVSCTEHRGQASLSPSQNAGIYDLCRMLWDVSARILFCLYTSLLNPALLHER